MVTLPQPRFRGRSSDVELWLSAFTPEKRALELNGALSNPRAEVELSRLRDVQKRLLLKAAANHMEPRPAPARPSPVLETITRVLELENRPMRAREIYSAAEELLGRPLLWKSVKGTLFNYAQGQTPRFVRASRGVYQLADQHRPGENPEPGRFLSSGSSASTGSSSLNTTTE